MKKLFTTLALAASLAVSANAHAWPDRPVSLIVPFSPGGSTDQMARSIGNNLQEQWKQSVVVENKAGASGTIGASFVTRAAPDGYTLLVTSLGPLVIVPNLLENVPYDVTKDFDYLTVGLRSPNVLVVPANSSYNSATELIAAMKANPNGLSFGSSGAGSSDHLTAEMFWAQTGTTGLHVPYKGGAPAVVDLLGGQLDAMFQNINAMIPHINGGKMKALAITSEQRSPLLPDVPTLGELGIKDSVVYSWQAVAAPKGLPADIKSTIHASLIKAFNDPKVKKQFVDIGFEVVANTPEEFTAYQKQESARWKQIIDSRNLKIANK